MKLDIFQKIGIGIGTILLLHILFSTVLTNNVHYEDLKFIDGQIESVERFKLKNKWSVSYDIRLKNNPVKFKVLPEYFSCVDASEKELKNLVNEKVILGIANNNRFKTNDNQSVVSLKINEEEFIDLGCVNTKIENSKTQIPLIVAGAITLFLVVLWGNSRLKKK